MTDLTPERAQEIHRETLGLLAGFQDIVEVEENIQEGLFRALGFAAISIGYWEIQYGSEGTSSTSKLIELVRIAFNKATEKGDKLLANRLTGVFDMLAPIGDLVISNIETINFLRLREVQAERTSPYHEDTDVELERRGLLIHQLKGVKPTAWNVHLTPRGEGAIEKYDARQALSERAVANLPAQAGD